jgi:hypothetical protein
MIGSGRPRIARRSGHACVRASAKATYMVRLLKTRVLLLLVAGLCGTLAAAGCSAGDPLESDAGVTGATGGAQGSGATGGNLSTGGSAGSGTIPVDAGNPTDPDSGGPCTPLTCTPAGGTYCGEIGDGCEGTLICPACTGDWTCQDNVCVGGPSCTPGACQAGTSLFCGEIGDGCGRKLDCGACANGDECRNGVCVTPGCVPIACATEGGNYCGTIGDGCGGTLECGECAGGATCGGGGIESVCGGAPDCVPVACVAENGGEYCGVIGNGCGGVLDCGGCDNGMTCTDNVCPGTGTGECEGLQCDIAMCPAGSPTVVSGTVYDPAGINPIYNARVYVPNAPLDPIPTGASCDLCSANSSGSPIATALTDTAGRFRIENVPTGTDIPLVIQVGKWRREIRVPSVTSCVDNPLTDKELTRLPRTQSEGNIPLMAVATGGSDALECLLRRIGIADSEFTTDTGNGRVHMYSGGPPGTSGEGTNSFAAGGDFPHGTTLWSNTEKMLGYDIHVLSCEGSQYEEQKEPYRANMKAYLDAGGRMFASHLHFDSDGSPRIR